MFLGHIKRSDLEFTSASLWNLPAQWPFGDAHNSISMLPAVENDYIYLNPFPVTLYRSTIYRPVPPIKDYCTECFLSVAQHSVPEPKPTSWTSIPQSITSLLFTKDHNNNNTSSEVGNARQCPANNRALLSFFKIRQARERSRVIAATWILLFRSYVRFKVYILCVRECCTCAFFCYAYIHCNVILS